MAPWLGMEKAPGGASLRMSWIVATVVSWAPFPCPEDACSSRMEGGMGLGMGVCSPRVGGRLVGVGGIGHNQPLGSCRTASGSPGISERSGRRSTKLSAWPSGEWLPAL